MNEPMVRYERFTKVYDVPAVEDLDLEVRDGEMLALVGPNGSGKTTTLKAAVGLLRPTSGRVLVDGCDPMKSGTAVRRLVGYLPQRLSFAETVTAGQVAELFAGLRGLDRSVALRALDRTDLSQVAGRRVGGFSGGMMQRLGLAVALMGEPRLLLVDEPTAALDPTGALAIRDLLADVRAEGRTVVFSSHDLAEVATLADRVAIFVDGRLRALGTPLELARRYGLVAAEGAGGTVHPSTVATSSLLEDVYRRVTCRPCLVS